MGKLKRLDLTRIRVKMDIETDREDDIIRAVEMLGAAIMLLWWPFRAGGQLLRRVSWRASNTAGLIDFTAKIILIHLLAYGYGLLWPYWLTRLTRSL